MIGWIIYFRQAADYNKQYINFYIEEGARLGVEIKLVLVEDLEFGIRNNSWFIKYQKSEVDYPDFVICRAIYPLLSRQLEYMGIRVFNNSSVAEICNDKARTYQYLASTKIAMADSCFYKGFQLDDIISNLNNERVVKAVEGHGGSQVFLLSPDQIRKGDMAEIKQALYGSDLVLQPKIGHKNQDLRVYVIGKEIIAAVLRRAKEGFRANFSLGGEVCLYELSQEERELVKIIIDKFDFGLVGIDFLIGDDGQLIFNEIEDVVGSRMLYKCSDINIVERYLRYILDSIRQ